MSDTRIAEVLAAELTLTQTLAELGMTHRPSDTKKHCKDILRDGEVVGTFNADGCWEWLLDGCPIQDEV